MLSLTNMAEPPGGNGAVSPPAGLPREVREQLAELDLELSEGERKTSWVGPQGKSGPGPRGLCSLEPPKGERGEGEKRTNERASEPTTQPASWHVAIASLL